jgi:hypothetical protein
MIGHTRSGVGARATGTAGRGLDLDLLAQLWGKQADEMLSGGWEEGECALGPLTPTTEEAKECVISGCVEMTYYIPSTPPAPATRSATALSRGRPPRASTSS